MTVIRGQYTRRAIPSCASCGLPAGVHGLVPFIGSRSPVLLVKTLKTKTGGTMGHRPNMECRSPTRRGSGMTLIVPGLRPALGLRRFDGHKTGRAEIKIKA